MGTIFKIDADNLQGPKYKAVIELLRDKINLGELKAGDKLPPVRSVGHLWQAPKNRSANIPVEFTWNRKML